MSRSKLFGSGTGAWFRRFRWTGQQTFADKPQVREPLGERRGGVGPAGAPLDRVRETLGQGFLGPGHVEQCVVDDVVVVCVSVL